MGLQVTYLMSILKVAESTALECLEKFMHEVIDIFVSEYLRHPTTEDMEHLL
jgi:hypothetical protein